MRFLRISSCMSGTVSAKSMCAHWCLSHMSQCIPFGFMIMFATLFSCLSIIFTPVASMLRCSKCGKLFSIFGSGFFSMNSLSACFVISALLLYPCVPTRLSISFTNSIGILIVTWSFLFSSVICVLSELVLVMCY